jgi:hypothetical protein
MAVWDRFLGGHAYAAAPVQPGTVRRVGPVRPGAVGRPGRRRLVRRTAWRRRQRDRRDRRRVWPRPRRGGGHDQDRQRAARPFFHGPARQHRARLAEPGGLRGRVPGTDRFGRGLRARPGPPGAALGPGRASAAGASLRRPGAAAAPPGRGAAWHDAGRGVRPGPRGAHSRRHCVLLHGRADRAAGPGPWRGLDRPGQRRRRVPAR